MKLVFIHQNCPGQFKHLAPHMASTPEHEVVFITRPGKPDLPGVTKVEYKPSRAPSKQIHHYLRLTEAGILNGQAVGMAAQKLKQRGFYPDVVVAHMGWGEALYIKEIWPRARLLGYFEWFYHPRGADVGFLERQPPDLDTACRITTRNNMHLLSLEQVDWGISPTRWQWQQHPAAYRNRLSVIHDGVDTDRARPNPEAIFTLDGGITLSRKDEVVTYIARNLEPYRGFPSFMEAAELIQKRRPNCHLLVVGGDGVSYGALPEGEGTYREQLLSATDLDRSRIHFLGNVPYQKFLQVLQVSSAHIYLTVPFVLSWSMLEAMSAECLVIGSRTPPVQEVIRDGHNGLLVDFFSPQEIADSVDRVLDDPDRMEQIRREARRTVLHRYSLDLCLKKQTKLIERLARGDARLSPAGGPRLVEEKVRRERKKRVRRHSG